MQHVAGTITTADGLALATRHWSPHPEAKAVVAIVHGIGEHSGRYAHVATHLMLHGYAVYAVDLRRHGRSEGEPRVYVDTFDEYLDDIDAFLDYVEGEIDGLPLFLLGHSLGGGIAAYYVIERGDDGLAGLVLSSASLQIPPDLSPIIQKAAGVLSRYLPATPIAKLDTSHLSRDPAVVRAYENDPLVYTGRVRPRVGAETLRVADHIQANAAALSLPLYLFHGTADKITDPAGSQYVHAHAASGDKTLKLYDGLYHETLNEPERDQVLADLTDWLDAHVDVPPAGGSTAPEAQRTRADSDRS